MNDKMYVSISINEAYIPYAYVMLTSLFENNKDRDICVFIMYGNIADESLGVFEKLEQTYSQEIVCMQVDQSILPEYLPRTGEWTVEVYYRLLLQELLPKKVTRIIQMDVDMIVNGPLSELFDIDFEGKSLVVCPDMSVGKIGLLDMQNSLFASMKDADDFVYFNAGIMLMNLEKMRENVSFETFLKIAQEHRHELFAQDQDLLNYIFYQDVKYADENIYDCFAKICYNDGKGYEWIKENACVIHFAGKKPWSTSSCRYDTEKIWWEYAKLTPYYNELLEKTFLGEMNDGYADATIRRLCKEKDDLYNLVMKMKQILPMDVL